MYFLFVRVGYCIPYIPRETEVRVGYFIPWNSLRERDRRYCKVLWMCVQTIEKKKGLCGEVRRDSERDREELL